MHYFYNNSNDFLKTEQRRYTTATAGCRGWLGLEGISKAAIKVGDLGRAGVKANKEKRVMKLYTRISN